MKTEEIIEGNKIIAEFIGQHVTPVELRRNIMVKSYYVDELKYHTSFEWLMTVVEDIMEIAKVEMKNNSVAKSCVIYNRDYDNHGIEDVDSLLTATYKAVVQFITWHNNQKKENGK